MTLLALATYGRKKAEFITDSLSFTPTADQTGQSPKSIVLHNIDAAALAKGPLDFIGTAVAYAFNASGRAANFDEFVDSAPTWLNELLQLYREVVEPVNASAVWFQPELVLVGWSDRAEEFAGYVCAAEDGFEPAPIQGLWCSPMPWSARPSDLELGNLPSDSRTETVRGQWVTKPPRPVPARLDDWRALAVDVRRERSLTRFARVPIGGNVTHTRLERGSVISKRIHSFDDTGEEFAKMVAGTMHPASLAAPCYCGSGAPFGECHLAEGLARPCPCESGSPIGECCWRTAGQIISQPQTASA